HAWFVNRLMFAEGKAPQLVPALTVAVASAFPGHPPYSGDIPLAQIVPHLTVGAGAPVSALRTAARAVDDGLPFCQEVRAMELWAGPPVEGRTQPAPWAQVRSYALGS